MANGKHHPEFNNLHSVVAGRSELITTGSLAVDEITVLSHALIAEIRGNTHPHVSISLLIDDEQVTQYRGGTAGNIAYTMALLGERPILLAATSDQDESYLRRLAELGVQVTHTHRSHLKVAKFSVITDRDNNQIATFMRGAMSDASSLTLLPWEGESVFAIISPHDPAQMRVQIDQCIELRIPYCYDIGQQISNTPPADLELGVRHAAVLIANDYEMQKLAELTGLQPDHLAAETPLHITTMGKDGAIIRGYLAEQPLQIPAAAVTAVVDPTGAGDAWRAGFFAGLHQGKDLAAAGAMAAVSAAYVVEQKGGQSHFFTPQQFAERLAAYQARFHPSAA